MRIAVNITISVLFIVAIAFAQLSGEDSADERWRAETVGRGLAQYCPLDGSWAWKGECGSAKP